MMTGRLPAAVAPQRTRMRLNRRRITAASSVRTNGMTPRAPAFLQAIWRAERVQKRRRNTEFSAAAVAIYHLQKSHTRRMTYAGNLTSRSSLVKHASTRPAAELLARVQLLVCSRMDMTDLSAEVKAPSARLIGSASATDKQRRSLCARGRCRVRPLLGLVLRPRGTQRNHAFRRRYLVFRGARPRQCLRPHRGQLFPRPGHALSSHDGRHGRGLDADPQPAHPMGGSASSIESDVCRCRRRWRMGRHVGFRGGRSARLRAALRDHLRHSHSVSGISPASRNRKSSRPRCPRSTSRAICTCAKDGPCAGWSS